MLPKLKTPAIEFATYRVQKGDSLISIANQHHVSLNELLAMNDVRKKNVLRIGQELKVPKPEEVVAQKEDGDKSTDDKSDEQPVSTPIVVAKVDQPAAEDKKQLAEARSRGFSISYGHFKG